jgi:hypothetical protein
MSNLQRLPKFKKVENMNYYRTYFTYIFNSAKEADSFCTRLLEQFYPYDDDNVIDIRMISRKETLSKTFFKDVKKTELRFLIIIHEFNTSECNRVYINYIQPKIRSILQGKRSLNNSTSGTKKENWLGKFITSESFPTLFPFIGIFSIAGILIMAVWIGFAKVSPNNLKPSNPHKDLLESPIEEVSPSKTPN